MKKLSIIVPVYNMAADRKLNYCLDSLLNQTISDYEIIAVDDCSTDHSMDILREYAEKYPDRVKAIHSPENRRQGGAKNLGLQEAKGEWIGFIDSDDWIAPDMYEKLLKKAEQTGADVVGCDYHITYEHSMKIGRIVQNNTMEQTGILDDEKYGKLILQPGSMVVKIYKHEVIRQNHLDFPAKVFYEDNCAAPVWLLHFRHFEKVEEPLYYYYQHSVSTVHHISEAKCNDRLTTGQMLVDQFKQYGFFERFKVPLEYRFTELYYVNTLFTYVAGVRPSKLSYLNKMKAGILKEFPDFRQNPYYLEKTDAEQKRMIDCQLKSSLLFLMYYRALWAYRRWRAGRKKSANS